MIYEMILREAQKAVDAGLKPNGVRLNKTTFEKLRVEMTPRQQLRFHKTTYDRISILDTDFGPMRLMYDKHMPDDAVIVLVAVPPLTRFPSHLYEMDGELHSEDS